MKYKNLIALASIVALIIIAGCSNSKNVRFDDEVTIIKSPSCGCCSVYSTYMENQGAKVNVKEVSNLQPLFDEYNIPLQLQSCHVSKIGDYIIVGHVPIEAIEKLMDEKPDIKGIALPEMPSGTPGMPGRKNADWIIYSLSNDGRTTEYMRI